MRNAHCAFEVSPDAPPISFVRHERFVAGGSVYGLPIGLQQLPAAGRGKGVLGSQGSLGSWQVGLGGVVPGSGLGALQVGLGAQWFAWEVRVPLSLCLD